MQLCWIQSLSGMHTYIMKNQEKFAVLMAFHRNKIIFLFFPVCTRCHAILVKCESIISPLLALQEVK